MLNSTSPKELQSAFQQGDIEIKGRFMLGSNYTFLVSVSSKGAEFQAVYKPSRGEQPLWDFPENTLALREVAAYVVSETLGFHFVPFTTIREEGPYGPGSLQQFIDYDPEYHYFNFTERDKELLRPVVLFDLLVNNADRKGSHVFFEKTTHKLWAIDHGICFHIENKLRTVLWDFAGDPIPPDVLSLLARTSDLPPLLEPYLSPDEIDSLLARSKALLKSKKFPQQPRDRRAFPYPPV
ncbi:MAG: SCO1664 family protein [Chloroflexota bacterium]